MAPKTRRTIAAKIKQIGSLGAREECCLKVWISLPPVPPSVRQTSRVKLPNYKKTVTLLETFRNFLKVEVETKPKRPYLLRCWATNSLLEILYGETRRGWVSRVTWPGNQEQDELVSEVTPDEPIQNTTDGQMSLN